MNVFMLSIMAVMCVKELLHHSAQKGQSTESIPHFKSITKLFFLGKLSRQDSLASISLELS